MASNTSHSRRAENPRTPHDGTLMPNREAAMWLRLIRPEQDNLTEDAARSFLLWSSGEEDRHRMHELAVRNKAGDLTSDEEAELDDYCRAGRLLDLMHSNARLSLKRHGSHA